ncbi:MAG: serine/threonine protein kinase, partial [Planctomycetes bacterium]|nr:serine/threonine protein kinase [Planctomycetota bacterium]
MPARAARRTRGSGATGGTGGTGGGGWKWRTPRRLDADNGRHVTAVRCELTRGGAPGAPSYDPAPRPVTDPRAAAAREAGDPAMSERSEQAIGGRWQPLRRLGAGASGEVLLVQDLARGGPPLALKRVPQARLPALHDEFRRLQALRSPGLPRVDELTLDPVGGDGLFTGEPARGTPFLAALRGAPLPVQLQAIADVLRTLALLGERGLVHRDLKPEHLLVDLGVDPPRVVLVDLGLAVAASAHAIPAGSLPYLAPELFRGEPPAPASDLYALGVVLHELWGSGLPFSAATPIEWARAHLDAPVRFAAGFSAPAALRELVARLLAKDPLARYRSAGECLADLSRAAAVPLPVATAATLQGRIRSVPPLGPSWREQVTAGEPRPGGPATWVTAPTRAGRDALLRELRITASQGEAW